VSGGSALAAVGWDEADGFAEAADDSDGTGQVRVVRDDNGSGKTAEMGVVDEVDGQVDVGALFLGFYDLNLLAGVAGKRHEDWLLEKVTVGHLDVGKRCERF